jgi:hypothetical protein
VRQFIRHATDVPIEVHLAGQLAQAYTHNVSHGGLAFQSSTDFEPGTLVDVRIPLVKPRFESRARVVWCVARQGAFDLGVEFLEVEDAFRARMVEQVCYIERYRQEVLRTEGRALSAQQAAMEWIGRYAADFPDPGSGESA